MKSNPVKQKLREGKPTFGTWLSLGNLHASRVLARSGFDWLTLDIEHGPFDWSHPQGNSTSFTPRGPRCDLNCN